MRTVLIVEDDLFIADMLHDAVVEGGYVLLSNRCAIDRVPAWRNVLDP